MRWWASLSYRSASGAMRHRSAPSRGRRPSADQRKGRQSRGWAGRPSPRQERLYPPWLKTGRGRRPGRNVRCVLYQDQIPVLRFFQARLLHASTPLRAWHPLPFPEPTIQNRQVPRGRDPGAGAPCLRATPRLTSAPARSLTVAEVVRSDAARRRIRQHLSWLLFYDGVERRSSARRFVPEESEGLRHGSCRRTLAWRSPPRRKSACRCAPMP